MDAIFSCSICSLCVCVIFWWLVHYFKCFHYYDIVMVSLIFVVVVVVLGHHELYYILLLLLSLFICVWLCDPVDGSPSGSPSPWDSPGKNTGVGCHFLLQCMKVKSASEVAQLCLTLSNPMDWSLPSSSVHGIFQASVLEWVAISFSHTIYWQP